MTFLTWVSVGIAVAATLILPAFLDRSRRLIGNEPSPFLLTYLIVLTPRWIATGALLMECMARGEWGAGHPELLRYGVAVVSQVFVGLVSFFSIVVSPPDLKAIPNWISRGLVAVGFALPMGQVAYSIWYLGLNAGFGTAWLGLGPLAGALFLTSAGFGTTVLFWALAMDMRAQTRLTPVAKRVSTAGGGPEAEIPDLNGAQDNDRQLVVQGATLTPENVGKALL